MELIAHPATDHVTEVVLTGGPGGGKTTAIKLLGRLLSRSGLRVITVPEVATLLIYQGKVDMEAIKREDPDANCKFQRQIFETHAQLRERALHRAALFAPQKTIIIYDRSEIDGLAWHDHNCFETFATESGTTLDQIRRRYDAVVHLVTAAVGAEWAYTQANNAARWESAAQAAARDAKVLRIWRDHPRLEVIDNRSDFPDKVDRVLGALLQLLDLPTQLTINLGHDVPAPEAIAADAAHPPEPVPA